MTRFVNPRQKNITTPKAIFYFDLSITTVYIKKKSQKILLSWLKNMHDQDLVQKK